MTQDEIIEMAEKTGVAFASEEYPDIWQTYMHVGKKELEAFAKLVAEKEREAWIPKVQRLQNLMDIREQQPNKPCCIAERKFFEYLIEEFCYGNTKVLIEKAIRARGQA